MCLNKRHNSSDFVDLCISKSFPFSVFLLLCRTEAIIFLTSDICVSTKAVNFFPNRSCVTQKPLILGISSFCFCTNPLFRENYIKCEAQKSFNVNKTTFVCTQKSFSRKNMTSVLHRSHSFFRDHYFSDTICRKKEFVIVKIEHLRNDIGIKSKNMSEIPKNS